jgi:GT2 family glycosyltransferase
MKILICGMPRSMTTWAFNAVRQILGDQPLKTLWIDPSDTVAEVQFVTAEDNIIAKCHHYSEKLAGAADCIIYSYRDIRAAGVSAFRKFSSDCTASELAAWVQAGRAWGQIADIILRYEQVGRNPADVVQRLRYLLGAKYGMQRLSSESDEILLSRIDASFTQRQSEEVAGHDAQSLILPAHRTFQPPPEELHEAERALYLRIEREFAPWLAEHFYIQQEGHGQTLDCRLAELLMLRLASPLIIVVGAECGAFIDLALYAGAGRVIAFERVPRHVGRLGMRFVSETRVEVHALALPESRAVPNLGDLVTDHATPAVDFLKLGTAGNGLVALRALDVLHPRFILVEYRDTLPQASGQTPCTLADLQAWATASGYGHAVVFRRHGRLESLEWWTGAWAKPGDWGNVLFIRDEADLPLVHAAITELAPQTKASNQDYVDILIKDCEAKETEIRRLDNALKAVRSQQAANGLEAAWKSGGQAGGACVPVWAQTNWAPSHPVAQEIAFLQRDGEKLQIESARCAETELELIRKEAVIQQQARALAAYRAAFLVLSPLLLPLNFVNRHVRAALRPRLGNLNQHPPRQLKLPRPYTSRLPVERLPSISLVTPSFQQAHFLGRTIDSVLGQGYPKLEYFVQDGGSTDGTTEVLRRYHDRLTGWQSEKDQGQSHAINLGFARTGGEIMAWLNSDDLLMPSALQRVGEYFAQHPEVDVVYGHRILIDEEDREIGRWVLPGHDDSVLSWADFVPQETLFWRRAIWEKAGGQIDESFRFAMDWDLLLRLRGAGARMVRLPWFLGAFRIHEAQKTSAQINEVGMAEMARLRQRVFGRDVSWEQARRGLMPYMAKHVAHDLAYRMKVTQP